MTSKEAFIKFTEYLVDVFNQRLGKNLDKDYFYNKDINFSIYEFPLNKILKDLEILEILKKELTPLIWNEGDYLMLDGIDKGTKAYDIVKEWLDGKD